jgi:hypothetical protein
LIFRKWADEGTPVKVGLQSDGISFLCSGRLRLESDSIYISSSDSSSSSGIGFFLRIDAERAISFDYRDARESPAGMDYVEEVLAIRYADAYVVVYVPR